jgi:transcriptional regulator with XRE-family HTH domain
MELSARLKQARESIAKSQKQMAKLAGASYRVWQSYEAGKVIPGGKIFEALSEHGFNANWLLTGKGSMRIEGMDDEMLSQKAVAKVKAVDIFLSRINDAEYLKTFTKVWSVIDPYVKNSNHETPEVQSLGLLSVIIPMILKKSDEWKTEKKVTYLLNIIEKLREDYKPLRDIGMSEDAAISLIRYLDDPDYMEHPEKFFGE